MKRYAVVEVSLAGGRIYFEDEWDPAFLLWKECFSPTFPAPLLLELDTSKRSLPSYGSVRTEDNYRLIEDYLEEAPV